MKRDFFDITAVNGHAAVKHAWNASIRHIEDVVRQIARVEGTNYRLIAAESEKDSSGNHVAGTRTWKGENGRTVTFSVRKRG